MDQYKNKEFGGVSVGRNYSDKTEFRADRAIYLNVKDRFTLQEFDLEEAEALIDHLTELTEEIRAKLGWPVRVKNREEEGLNAYYVTFGPEHVKALNMHWATNYGYVTVMAPDREIAAKAVGWGVLAGKYAFMYGKRPDFAMYTDGETARFVITAEYKPEPVPTKAESLAIAVYAEAHEAVVEDLEEHEIALALRVILPLIEAAGLVEKDAA